jgi:transketolase
MADFTQSEDHAARFQAIGWNTVSIDGHDFKALDKSISEAKANKNGKPTIIIAQTLIGKGIPEVEGTNAAHGEAGVPYQKTAREGLGLPADELWYVDPETKKFFATRKEELKKAYNTWQDKFSAWSSANPALASELTQAREKKWPSAAEVLAAVPEYDASKNVATRQSGSDVLQHVAKLVPQMVSGSADLHGSNKNYIAGGENFGNPKIKGKSFNGRNFYFGIREHAMGTMLNGIMYYGLNLASASTFLVFADYMRAAIRVAALSELQAVYILTHDSVGVGEDGPTHQPVEAVSGLRTIPNVDVLRPADPEEVAGAFACSVERQDGPTALIFSRQNVRTLNEIPVQTRREGTLKGGYVAIKETGPLERIILSAGSELQWACDAAKELGAGTRVVSMPCMERFDRQSAAYKEEVLPSSCTARIAIEAGVTPFWHKYTGLNGKVIGTDAFGFSAPGDVVMKEFGITTENLVKEAKSL